MALFATIGVEEINHMFISPGSLPSAKPLIAQYSGHPCNPPSSDDIAFVAGHDDARDFLTKY